MMIILIILLSYIILGVMTFIILNEAVIALSKWTESSSYDLHHMIKTSIQNNKEIKYPNACYIFSICSAVMIWPIFHIIFLSCIILILIDYFRNEDE